MNKIYNLEFTKENVSAKSWTVLEMQVNVQEDRRGFLKHFSYRWKGSLVNIPHRREMAMKQWIDPSSVNAKWLCRVYLPAAMRKM